MEKSSSKFKVPILCYKNNTLVEIVEFGSVDDMMTIMVMTTMLLTATTVDHSDDASHDDDDDDDNHDHDNDIW